MGSPDKDSGHNQEVAMSLLSGLNPEKGGRKYWLHIISMTYLLAGFAFGVWQSVAKELFLYYCLALCAMAGVTMAGFSAEYKMQGQAGPKPVKLNSSGDPVQ